MNLEVFKNDNFGQIRSLIIDNEPYFVGKDIANALGYKNTRDAVSNHVDKDDKTEVAVHDGRQNRNMTIINESGLYSLILSSKLPQAKSFKKWVTSEVLPTIRKTGSYVKPKTTMELLELEFQAIKEVKEEVAEVKEDLASFKEELPILALDIEKITKAKNKVAVNLLGGKDSKAYKNNSIRGKVYTDIARELKRQFGLETYKALKRNEVVKAIEVISNYKLPLCLKEEIKKVNKG